MVVQTTSFKTFYSISHVFLSRQCNCPKMKLSQGVNSHYCLHFSILHTVLTAIIVRFIMTCNITSTGKTTGGYFDSVPQEY